MSEIALIFTVFIVNAAGVGVGVEVGPGVGVDVGPEVGVVVADTGVGVVEIAGVGVGVFVGVGVDVGVGVEVGVGVGPKGLYLYFFVTSAAFMVVPESVKEAFMVKLTFWEAV